VTTHPVRSAGTNDGMSSLKIPDPLLFAASFLVLGFLARRVIPVTRPFWRVLCQAANHYCIDHRRIGERLLESEST
jgi:hypothetical protein